MLVVVGEDFQVIAGCFKSSLKDSEVEWRHLRAENGVLLTHLLGKGYLLNGSRIDVPFLFCACFARMAAIRERIRILAAPRLLTSSIFRQV